MPAPGVTARDATPDTTRLPPVQHGPATYRHFAVHHDYSTLSNGFRSYDEMTAHVLERGTPT